MGDGRTLRDGCQHKPKHLFGNFAGGTSEERDVRRVKPQPVLSIWFEKNTQAEVTGITVLEVG